MLSMVNFWVLSDPVLSLPARGAGNVSTRHGRTLPCRLAFVSSSHRLDLVYFLLPGRNQTYIGPGRGRRIRWRILPA